MMTLWSSSQTNLRLRMSNAGYLLLYFSINFSINTSRGYEDITRQKVLFLQLERKTCTYRIFP